MFKNVRKGSESVIQHLQRITEARDSLFSVVVGVNFADEDNVILALIGRHAEHNTFIRCVIRGQESAISLKD